MLTLSYQKGPILEAAKRACKINRLEYMEVPFDTAVKLVIKYDWPIDLYNLGVETAKQALLRK